MDRLLGVVLASGLEEGQGRRGVRMQETRTGYDQADGSARELIRHTKRVTRRRFTPEEKVRIVIEGIRGEIPISTPCRREGIRSNVYYKWLKDFMEAGKARLEGDTLRGASRAEVEVPKRGG